MGRMFSVFESHVSPSVASESAFCGADR
jgi:hypothetical protein